MLLLYVFFILLVAYVLCLFLLLVSYFNAFHSQLIVLFFICLVCSCLPIAGASVALGVVVGLLSSVCGGEDVVSVALGILAVCVISPVSPVLCCSFFILLLC